MHTSGRISILILSIQYSHHPLSASNKLHSFFNQHPPSERTWGSSNAVKLCDIALVTLQSLFFEHTQISTRFEFKNHQGAHTLVAAPITQVIQSTPPNPLIPDPYPPNLQTTTVEGESSLTSSIHSVITNARSVTTANQTDHIPVTPKKSIYAQNRRDPIPFLPSGYEQLKKTTNAQAENSD